MKSNCNHSLKTLLLLALIAPTALAGPAPSTSIAVDCAHRYISQRDAARVLGSDNFSQTYAKRQSLYANVARLCRGGADRVLLVASDLPDRARTAATR